MYNLLGALGYKEYVSNIRISSNQTDVFSYKCCVNSRSSKTTLGQVSFWMLQNIPSMIACARPLCLWLARERKLLLLRWEELSCILNTQVIYLNYTWTWYLACITHAKQLWIVFQVF